MVMLNDGGPWIKAEEVEDGSVLAFLNEGEWRENEKFKNPDGTPKNDFIFKVDHELQEKNFRCNANNRKALLAVWGRDTAGWVGKRAKIAVVNMNVGGKKYKGIELTPLEEKQA